MFVGRDDYIVRSLKTRGLGKQLWNVTYSRLRCLDPGSLFTSPDIDVDADRLAHEGHFGHCRPLLCKNRIRRCIISELCTPARACAHSPAWVKFAGLLTAGSDGALYRMEQESQRETWAIKLGSHPVGAFLDGRGHNLLLRDTAAKVRGEGGEGTSAINLVVACCLFCAHLSFH
jgi:hypothetical protein